MMLNSVKFSVDQRTSGIVTNSEIFGYRPRLTGSIGKKTCNKTTFGNKYKAIEDALNNVVGIADKLYSKYNPRAYSKHQEYSNKVLSQYLIDDTVFTSGIINKNNPLKYHYDTGNFRGVSSIMLGLKSPGSKGGYLSMPEYGIALEVADGSISMFDGQEQIHGVTPIEGRSKNSYRYTIVMYSLLQMWSCGTSEEEILLARKREEEKLARLLERIKNGE